MEKPASVMEDKRTIMGLGTGGEEGYWWEVGRKSLRRDPVTKIVVYKEAGQHCYVPWFAVYSGERIINRVNGAFVDNVWYREAPDA